MVLQQWTVDRCTGQVWLDSPDTNRSAARREDAGTSRWLGIHGRLSRLGSWTGARFEEQLSDGLPCQQDDRSVSAARLRGTVQRLIPQTPTSTDPRSYRLETVAAGQRFPMGLAMDTMGRLFATDNQGNYNRSTK